MTGPGWLTRSLADVPVSDDWLSPGERDTLGALRLPKRRADWRLGRWTAKAAVGAWLGEPPKAFEIAAARDGAPEALLGGEAAPVTLSLSHRSERALAVVCKRGADLGCDLEIVELRSEAFVSEWLAPVEQAVVASAGAEGRTLVANVLWTAKEAAAKARREGLRLDPRHIVIALDGKPRSGGWRALTARLPRPGGTAAEGWWREEPGWVMAVVAKSATGPPVRL